MHAITTILVREHEILACMIEIPQARGSAPSSVVDNDHIDYDDEDGEEYKVDVPAGELQVTAIANPNHDIVALLPEEGPDYMHMPADSNFWPEILKSESGWSFLHR
jgi:hypothetical protein